MTAAPTLRSRAIAAAIDVVTAIPPLHRWVNQRIINKYAYATALRPRPLSMAADYATWRGLTDRKYSGRHLPPKDLDLPPFEDVVALFDRAEDRRANDTTLLFPFFAQWFTDSFLRTKWKPEDVQDFAENESNHEIDLCQIYGLSETQTRMLRAMEGGRLKSQMIDGQEWPVFLFEEHDGALRVKPEFEGLHSPDNFARVFANADDAHRRTAFATGLEHGNVTIGNTLMNTVFLREHNRVAGVIAAAHPGWDDERVFQTTRNVLIVELLKIVIGDYIVHIAPLAFPLRAFPGMAEGEGWYRTNWISVEFALLYRWHDLIPATVTFDGETRDSEALKRDNAWAMTLGVERMALDAADQLAGRIGLANTAPFLKIVKELSLKMARKCRLDSYNAYREHYGLTAINRFDELTGEAELSGRLAALYGSMDRLEWFVGIFAERYGEADLMGELLMTMVANDAFTQALTNPLLARAVYTADTFSAEGLAILDATDTLADVIARNSRIEDKSRLTFTARAA